MFNPKTKKMKRITVIMLLVSCISLMGIAQNQEKPWAVGLGLHWADFHGLREGGASAMQDVQFQGGFGEFSIARYLSPLANLQLTVGTLTFKPEKYDLAGYGEIMKDNLLNFDLDYVYKFLGETLPADCKVVPYIYGGLGGQSFNDEFQLKVQAGLGFDYWAFKDLGIYLRGDYSYPLDRKIVNYWHPHVGLKFRFGTGGKAVKAVSDRDGDGIADNVDKCPDVPGVIANKGCPDLTQAEREQIINIAKAVYFDTGKDVIKPESKTKLDELLPILSKYPKMNLVVEGHTDNVGDDASNLKLSQDRVNAVKKYLVEKGIAASRISAVGYGEKRPVATNDTDAGRAQNRRVEIKTDF